MFSLTPYTTRRNDLRAYNPFKEMEDLEKSFFGGSGLSEFKTDIVDNGDSFMLEADLPGFKKEDINIDIDGEVLKISAERKSEHDEKDKNGNYVYRERSFGSYARSFDISGINTESIDASYADGVLKLVMPKKAKEVPSAKRLEIR